MADYTFTLKYRLPPDLTGDEAVDALGAAGCSDALAGIGVAGRLALEFDRAAANATGAMRGAIQDVQSAVPRAELIEAGPDLVGLSDIAELVGVSRQNMRQLVLGTPTSPLPAHDGSTTLWHLVEVLDFLVSEKGYSTDQSLREVALAARGINLENLIFRHDRSADHKAQQVAV